MIEERTSSKTRVVEGKGEGSDGVSSTEACPDTSKERMFASTEVAWHKRFPTLFAMHSMYCMPCTLTIMR